MALFASGLAPLVSLGFSSILMALFSSILGVGYGFLIPIFSNQAIRFHGGYTLYNIGFAGGVFAIIIYSIIKFFGFEYPLETQISESHTTELLIILFLISTVYLLAGLTNMKTGKVSTLKKLYSLSGRAVSDFTSILSKEVTYLNIGILGYFLIVIFLITQVEVTGIIAGGFLTVIGFGAFGKHLKNIIPIICGIFLAGYYAQGEINESVMVIALFGTCLAPIAGDFGFFAGLIAGCMHYTLVQNTSEWQGGINLYNNGFAAGFVAAILSSIFDKLDLKVMVKNIFKSS